VFDNDHMAAAALVVILMLFGLLLAFVRLWRSDRRTFWPSVIGGLILFLFLLSMRWW
jgi:isoprenylcysteine carboxyl methyltransferase (ICMT) family protein YpbQ